MTSEPAFRPGLPREAARAARRQGERLVQGEALLDARDSTFTAASELLLDALYDKTIQGSSHVEIDAGTLRTLIEEVRALRIVAEHRMTLLEAAADSEARRFGYLLRYGLVRLADDAYIPWTENSDAPVGWVMTEAEALERGWTRARLDRAAIPDADGYLANSAGPGEQPLTVAAILEAYASQDAHRAFRLTPAKVLCGTTQDMWQNPDTKQWESGPVYWDPWHPDETPEMLPDGWKDRF